MKDKSNKVIVDKGQIVKISKDKNGVVTKEKWSLSCYWTNQYTNLKAFCGRSDFRSKREENHKS